MSVTGPDGKETARFDVPETFVLGARFSSDGETFALLSGEDWLGGEAKALGTLYVLEPGARNPRRVQLSNPKGVAEEDQKTHEPTGWPSAFSTLYENWRIDFRGDRINIAVVNKLYTVSLSDKSISRFIDLSGSFDYSSLNNSNKFSGAYNFGLYVPYEEKARCSASWQTRPNAMAASHQWHCSI